MTLAEHARRELELLGEEPAVIDWYLRVIAEFDSIGHSGASHAITVDVLHKLLQFHNLTPLTDDPAEWEDRSRESGVPLWQNRRNPEAFSDDQGHSYRLLHDPARTRRHPAQKEPL